MNKLLNGVKVVPFEFIPDGELWVNPNMYIRIKEAIPEVKNE